MEKIAFCQLKLCSLWIEKTKLFYLVLYFLYFAEYNYSFKKKLE